MLPAVGYLIWVRNPFAGSPARSASVLRFVGGSGTVPDEISVSALVSVRVFLVDLTAADLVFDTAIDGRRWRHASMSGTLGI